MDEQYVNPKAPSRKEFDALADHLAQYSGVIVDEAISAASKQYTIPAHTLALVLARCNASEASTAPAIKITNVSQNAQNTGAVGGSCMCYALIGTSLASQTVTVEFTNYVTGTYYMQYGRVTIIKVCDF